MNIRPEKKAPAAQLEEKPKTEGEGQQQLEKAKVIGQQTELGKRLRQPEPINKAPDQMKRPKLSEEMQIEQPQKDLSDKVVKVQSKAALEEQSEI